MRQKRALTADERRRRFRGDTGGILSGGGGIFPRSVMFRFFGKLKEASHESQDVNPIITSSESKEMHSHRERL